MKRYLGFALAALVISAVTAATPVRADNSMGSMGSAKPTIFMPATLKWMPGQGDMKGLQVAALEGDPSKPGPWTIRLLLPAGTKFPAHYHPDTERVTVISGTLLVGVGKVFDMSKLMALPAGSYCIIPAGVRHYAAAKVATVIQLSGNGPFGMMMDKKGM